MITQGAETDGRSTVRHVSGSEAGEQSPLLQRDDDYDYDDDVPYKGLSSRQFHTMFACVLIAHVIIYFDSTFMASSHPVITSYFNASHVASWLSTTFFLATTVSQPLYGRFSDIFGRRSVNLCAMAIFAAGTLWCTLAQSIGSLIVARAAAGLGTGGIISLSAIVLADTIKIEHRSIYQSYLNMAIGVGNGLGAALGGILCERLGWRAVFGLQIPFVVAFMILAYAAIPSNLGPCLAMNEGKTAFEALKSFDTPGAFCLTIAVTALILGINLGGNVFPWDHPLIIISLVAFALAVPLFIWIERKATSPVLPPSLLSNKPFANVMWSNSLSTGTGQVILFNVPLLLQAVRGMSPTDSGLYMFAPLAGVMIGSVMAGVVIKRTGSLKLPMVIGSTILLLGVLPLSFLGDPKLPNWSIVVLTPWAHFGHGLTSTTNTVALLAVCEAGEQAVVMTTLGLSRMLGSMIGIAVSSWAVQNFLILYLRQKVTGNEQVRAEIISRVRKSVRAIQELDPIHKAEAINAYALSLRNTFLCFLVTSVVICCLIFPLQLPRLKVHRSADDKAVNEEQIRSNNETSCD